MERFTGTERLDLFLVEKTGHGKSSTGNSLLGREDFNVSENGDSETKGIQGGYAKRLGKKIKVVDGPGICETRMSRGEAAEKAVEDMADAIAQCPDGFHAMLLVMRFGNRYTLQLWTTHVGLTRHDGASI